MTTGKVMMIMMMMIIYVYCSPMALYTFIARFSTTNQNNFNSTSQWNKREKRNQKIRKFKIVDGIVHYFTVPER